MKALIVALLCAAALMPARAADNLYRDLGETAGITAVMGDFVDRLKADAVIGHFFKETSRKFLVKQLSDQVCQVTGGPCVYDGETMKKSHEKLKIGSGDFNRLVEVLQDAMDARRVPFATQRALLARLAPMHRDVVTQP